MRKKSRESGTDVELEKFKQTDPEKERRSHRIAEDEYEDGAMFRELNKVDTPLLSKWRKAALVISYLSIAITLAVGVTFFVFSTLAGSTAAFGFAFAAVLDMASSIVVVWRFSGSGGQKYSVDKERRACIAISVCFIVSAFAIAGKAVYCLVRDSEPRREFVLVIVTVASLVLMLFLAWSKYYISYKVDSRALKADAFNSTAGAIMSFGMIVSDVIYDENEGVWFLDAITAICIAFVLFIYGFRTILDLTLNQDMKPVPSSEGAPG